MQPQLETEITPFAARPPKRPAPRKSCDVSAELRELRERYLSWMLATRYAEATIKGAGDDVAWLYRFLALRGIARIADVTPEILNEYSLWFRDHKPRQNEAKAVGIHQIANRLHGVKVYFRWLAQNMIVLADPAEDLEVPRIVRSLPQTILTQEEARRLLDAPDLRSPVGYRDKAMLELIYATGIRTGELLRLKIADFDVKARTVFVRQGKGGKDRIIPLPSTAAGYLKEYIEKVRPRMKRYGKFKDQGYLFVSYNGTPFIRNRMKDVMKRSAQLAGIDRPVTAMILRHSIATHLLENGMGIRYIQEFLGHEDMRTTTIYSKATLKGMRRYFNKHHPQEKRARQVTGAKRTW